MGKALVALPDYLAKNGYKNPTDSMNTAWQMGQPTPLHIFGWLQENPKVFEQFNNHMAGYALNVKLWVDPGCVPIKEILGGGSLVDKDSVLLVDVGTYSTPRILLSSFISTLTRISGGGVGHDLIAFQKRYPSFPGRLVLQDLPEVIATVSDLPPGIEAMAHDFFTEQPVKSAKAYYLHSVLHDWPDEKCLEILKSLIPAMTKGYSKILINENVIPEKGAYWMTTAVDALMMTAFASMERTEKHWKHLLNSVGLKLVKVYNYEQGTPSLIEAELA